MSLWIVADHTLREAVRRRVVLAAAVVIGGFLALYGVGVWFGYRDISTDPDLTASMQRVIVGFMLQGGMWSLNFVASLLAIFLAVGSISGEIDQGTMHAVAARPVRRCYIVLGKFLGNLLLLTVFIGISTAVMIAVVAIITGQFAERAWTAPFAMLFAAAILLAVTIAGSTRLGTLANGVVVFTLYAVALVGGVIEQIGNFLDNPVTFDIGIATSVLLPTRALWDLAGTQLAQQSASTTGMTGGPFSSLNPPSGWMLLVAAVYLVLALAYAVRAFQRRDI